MWSSLQKARHVFISSLTLCYILRIELVTLAGSKINRSRFYGSLNEGLGGVYITTWKISM
jgi:hypothetical protein